MKKLRKNPSRSERERDILAWAKQVGGRIETRIAKDVRGDASTLNDLTAYLAYEIDKAQRAAKVRSAQFVKATERGDQDARKKLDAEQNAQHRLIQALRYLEMRVEQLAEEVTASEISENPMARKKKRPAKAKTRKTKRKASKKKQAKRRPKGTKRKNSDSMLRDAERAARESRSERDIKKLARLSIRARSLSAFTAAFELAADLKDGRLMRAMARLYRPDKHEWMSRRNPAPLTFETWNRQFATTTRACGKSSHKNCDLAVCEKARKDSWQDVTGKRPNPTRRGSDLRAAASKVRDLRIGHALKKRGLSGAGFGVNPKKKGKKRRASTARKIACHAKAAHDLLHGRKAKKCNPHKLSGAAKKFLRKKITRLVREGKPVKQAVAIAFRMARKKGFAVPVLKNPLLGVTTLIGHLPALMGSNPKRCAKKNPNGREFKVVIRSRRGRSSVRYVGINAAAASKSFSKRLPFGFSAELWARKGESGYSSQMPWHLEKRKTGEVTRNPKKKARRKSNPTTRTVRYVDMNAHDRKKYRKDAQMAARFAGASIRDVVFDDVPTPHGFKKDDAFVEVGEEVAVEYRVRGRKSERFGYTWRHRAGDNGKGKKKTKPPIIAIHRKSGQQVTVSQPGTRRTFSPDEGLKG